jgi:TM2 domain-containing membrane protein YozV
VAGALGILLGPFGVHRFYLGFTGIGVLQAVLTIGSVFILTPVVAIWAFIEGVLCFCGAMHDIDGLPLRG